MSDAVHQPDHYTVGGIETKDFIKSRLSPVEWQGYCRGNAIKYHSRANWKGGAEDLRKAGVYQGWLEESLAETSEAEPGPEPVATERSWLLYALGHSARQEVQATGQAPDRIIGEAQGPGRDYLRRWYLLRDQALGSIYLHQFGRSDDDRALHDHPWDWMTVILAGRYREHTPAGTYERRPGDMVQAAAEDRHRVELIDSEVWTLFITGHRRRQWGFEVPGEGWLDHHAYLRRYGEPGPAEAADIDRERNYGGDGQYRPLIDPASIGARRASDD